MTGTSSGAQRVGVAVEETAEGEFIYPLVQKLPLHRYRIHRGFVTHMITDAMFFANDALAKLMFEELQEREHGGFLPALHQMANVACLPGIVGFSMGMPDAHSGYGFSIGGVAAIDMENPISVVSPGGVGFDINCGVRLIRTNLTEEDVRPVQSELAQALFDSIPVGVGTKGGLDISMAELNEILNRGMDWLVERGIAWPEDAELCEERGSFRLADASKVSNRAKSRGLAQIGTLGSGNHYCEVQVVDEVFDEAAASAMGLRKGQVVAMLHSGSRGLGHQVCTDFVQRIQSDARGQQPPPYIANDRQLAGALVSSTIGRDYLAAMAAAANFAWANRGCMTSHIRNAFASVFRRSPERLDMHVVYDVSHNIAKIERHMVDGVERTLLVHRKGATRAFPPGHPEIPERYRSVGQPVLIGGSMGTASYVLTGTEHGMAATFGSTCHGAGRSLSRSQAKRELTAGAVMRRLNEMNVTVRVATPSLIAEEAPESYKSIDEVVNTCHEAGISKLCVRLRPVAVVKG